MPHLTVDHTENGADIDLYYEDLGSGRPVVLIHGWPLDSSSWEHQVPALINAGYRVITYDRRGFGRSSRPWNGYEYDRLAADLKAVLDHLDLREVTIVGFSMGGGEVARYLGSYGSDRIAQAVFASAVTPYLHQTADNPKGAIDNAMITSFQGAVISDRAAFLEDFVEGFFGAGDKTDLVSKAQKHAAWSSAIVASPKGTLDCIAAFAETDFRPDLVKVDVPTLVLHGDADGTVPLRASGERTAEAINGAQLHVIEGGPHGCNVSHADAFNGALVAFLVTAPTAD